MKSNLIRKIKKGIKNIPNFVNGFNIYVSSEKLQLIRHTFNLIQPTPISFADLGGVWKVNAAYTIYTLQKYDIKKAFIVDTHYDRITNKKLKKYDNITKIKGNFGDDSIIEKIGKVDVIYFFDVLLHQVNPDWNEILMKYSKVSNIFIIYNQQLINNEKTIRLTDLPLEKYKKFAPQRKDGLYNFVYTHRDEINQEYNRPWIDIHNIWQWGITGTDLENTMNNLGFEKVFFKNFGGFSNSAFFEDHAFIFTKK
jgi:hypothetical protein